MKAVLRSSEKRVKAINISCCENPLLDDQQLIVQMNISYPILSPLSTHAAGAPCALAVMIKAPRAGAVKTRLVPPLTPEEAAALSVCFLRDTTANIAEVASTGVAEGVAVYTPVGAETVFAELLPPSFSLLAQRGESFGDRLFHAAEDLSAVGYQSFCLIDSDSPTLPRALIEMAVAALARPGDRVVLGAAQDGGYYLIGLKRPHRRLFTDVEWSTAKVLRQTIERAAEIELEAELLPAWYDVDDALTLSQLLDEMFSPNGARKSLNGLVGYEASHTRDYLARLIETEGRARVWPETAKSEGAAK